MRDSWQKNDGQKNQLRAAPDRLEGETPCADVDPERSLETTRFSIHDDGHGSLHFSALITFLPTPASRKPRCFQLVVCPAMGAWPASSWHKK
jgi:hypothetical protein